VNISYATTLPPSSRKREELSTPAHSLLPSALLQRIPRLQLGQHVVARLLRDHKGRDDREDAGNAGEGAGVDHAQTTDAADAELGIEHGHGIVVAANLACR